MRQLPFSSEEVTLDTTLPILDVGQLFKEKIDRANESLKIIKSVPKGFKSFKADDKERKRVVC